MITAREDTRVSDDAQVIGAGPECFAQIVQDIPGYAIFMLDRAAM